MSTVTSAGPVFVVEGPTPEAPPHSLLNTPGVIETDTPASDGRFIAAATVFGHPADTPFSWVACETGTDAVKEEGGDIPQADFQSFAVYVPVGCSFRGRFGVDELQRKAEEVLEATQSHEIERVLAHGKSTLPNQPHFADANLVNLTPAAAVSPGVGLSILDQAIGGITGRQGMIHVTPGTVDALGVIPVGSEGPTDLVTAAGNPIVVGSGYIDPEKDFDGSGAFDTVDWMFATGPVRVYLQDDIFVPELEEALDRSTNDWVMRPERYVYAYWDTALQVGVRVDWST